MRQRGGASRDGVPAPLCCRPRRRRVPEYDTRARAEPDLQLLLLEVAASSDASATGSALRDVRIDVAQPAPDTVPEQQPGAARPVGRRPAGMLMIQLLLSRPVTSAVRMPAPLAVTASVLSARAVRAWAQTRPLWGYWHIVSNGRRSPSQPPTRRLGGEDAGPGAWALRRVGACR